MTESGDPAVGGGRRLAALGVPADDEFLYRALLTHPRATVAELTAATHWDAARVRRRARSLEQRGMLTRVRVRGRPVRFTPAPPEVAVELLALQRREEIERARLAGALLTAEFPAARRYGPGPPAVQTLSGPEAIDRRYRQLHRAVREELLILGRPPAPVPPLPSQRQVRRRAIYGHGALETPEELALCRESALRGEEGRVLAEVPLRLVIADRGVALVFLVRAPGEAPAPQPAPATDALVLHPSALLDGLVSLYELLWQRSVPLWPGGERSCPELSGDDEHLLALSASGLTDQAIARRLGVAQRTVERRMRRIMDLLGARTRFQAGLQAAHRGVITVGRTGPGDCPLH
ncbi:helix-turn-helix domain-containing protein [Streptomyces sp. NPDC020965]|uniref:helix-turn-helix domain-containing protein n=1 Tax=Streptomyces sp. NPDC020965 TaxID=3365105 RepID=UPI00379756E0